jgi:hypothetical protein
MAFLARLKRALSGPKIHDTQNAPLKLPEFKQTVFLPEYEGYASVFENVPVDPEMCDNINGNAYTYLAWINRHCKNNILADSVVAGMNSQTKPFAFIVQTGDVDTVNASVSSDVTVFTMIVYIVALYKHYAYACSIYGSAFPDDGRPPVRDRLETAHTHFIRCLTLIRMILKHESKFKYLQDVARIEEIKLIEAMVNIVLRVVQYFLIPRLSIPGELADAMVLIKRLPPPFETNQFDKKEMGKQLLTLVVCWCTETLEQNESMKLPPPFQEITYKMADLFLTTVIPNDSTTSEIHAAVQPLQTAINNFASNVDGDKVAANIKTKIDIDTTALETIIKTLQFKPVR